MKDNISSVKIDNCSGCSLCFDICPKRAIEMKENKEGFLYPAVASEKCNHCGLCYDKCPFEHVINKNIVTCPEAWSCWHKDEHVLMESSSGGVFTALAEEIIDQDGIVYGASLDIDLSVKHVRISSKDKLNILRGSKYTQSDVSGVYAELKRDVLANRHILFVGTPCQIAGIYSFIGKTDAPLLYTCDLICHGVNSPLVFKSYLSYVSQKLGYVVKSVCFRVKEPSWEDFSIKFIYSGGHKNVRALHDPFFFGFWRDYYLRLSCYACHYARLPRIADLTIGDLWCWDQSNKPKNFNPKGTSLVLINNKKGKELFQKVAGHKIVANTADLNKAILHNPNISKHTEYPRDFNIRSKIFNLIENNKLDLLFGKVLKPKYSLGSKINYYLNNPQKLLLKLRKFK